MRLALYIIYSLFLILSGIAVGFTVKSSQPDIVYVEVPVKEHIERQTFRVEAQYIEKPVSIHNEPELHEFNTVKELTEYITWYRNERMVQWGEDQCEDYAYDFMQQAVADGYLVSTEVYETKVPDLEILHMANTAPVKNGIYLIDISSGAVELLALKD